MYGALISHLQSFAPWIAIVLGLVVGSFLNVVIARLPGIFFPDQLKENTPPDNFPPRPLKQSDADSAAATAQPTSDSNTDSVTGSLWALFWSRSHCPKCDHLIPWYDNIPILSFLWLRGRCRYCRQPILWQYPLVEFLAALLAWSSLTRFGANVEAVIWSVFLFYLLVVAIIDLKTMLIPDALTLSGIWLGLLINCTDYATVGAPASILGAVIGYVAFYFFYHIFLLITGKEGLGYGDFKLVAMFGAWMGPTALLSIVFYASLFGSLFGLALYMRDRRSRPFAFGPWLALAAALVLLFPSLSSVFGGHS